MYALITLFSTAVIALFAGIFSKNRQVVTGISLVGTAGALVAVVVEWMQNQNHNFDSPMMVFDRYGLAFGGVCVLSTLLIVGLSGWGFRNIRETLGDHYGLILFSLCGALCMLTFQNLVMLFLGIEILSIPLYVLAGSRRDDLSSNEAALKYYLMGAFATGILLFGIALVYGSTRSFDLTTIAANMSTSFGSMPAMLHVGILMILAAMAFKVSAAPFHFWAPDVYEGSPTMITLFMSTVVKTAAFGAFFRLFAAFVPAFETWGMILAVMSALTMTIANITAIYQQSVKRMLAYSSISHAGYLLMGLIGLGTGNILTSGSSLLLYTASYSIASICIFAVYLLVNEQTGRGDFSAFNGLGKRKPFLAFIMTAAMLSLAGIPPLAGFFGKYMLFTGIISDYPWLTVIAIINSAISIYYYFRIIIAMYFHPQPENAAEVKVPAGFAIVAVTGMAIVVAICVMPGIARMMLL